MSKIVKHPSAANSSVNETGANDIPDAYLRYSDGISIFNMANNLKAGDGYRFRINLAYGPGIQFRIGIK